VVTPAEFTATLTHASPPRGLAAPLAALWWARKGDWHRAHRLVQEEASPEAAWVHAYLHRLEGDRDNAAYWYRRAGRPCARGALEEEWSAITAALLAAG